MRKQRIIDAQKSNKRAMVKPNVPLFAHNRSESGITGHTVINLGPNGLGQTVLGLGQTGLALGVGQTGLGLGQTGLALGVGQTGFGLGTIYAWTWAKIHSDFKLNTKGRPFRVISLNPSGSHSHRGKPRYFRCYDDNV